ncbi:MAG: trigger factor [Bacteroidia bacterium]|nr:MAG: trigger factor [Bacteroidia bacterium]
MTVSKTDKENLIATISVQITEEDYKETVKKELNKYRKSAQIKGFRPGKAPLALIQKMVGHQVLSKELDRLVSESLADFIEKEKLSLLGQPLPSVDQKSIDLDQEKTFEFLFDIGLSPEIDLKIDKEIQLPYYKVKTTKEDIDLQVERYRQREAVQNEKDKISEKSYIKGNITQCKADGSAMENPISSEDVLMSVDIIKDSDEQKKFIGKKKEDTVLFDIKKAYPNDTEIAGILSIDKDQVATTEPYFQILIHSITETELPALDEKFFDQVYPKAEIKTEEDFRKKVEEELAELYKNESGYRFAVDAKKYLLEKNQIQLPDAFLKRWITATQDSQKLNEETLEKEYPIFAENTAWQLIKGDIADKQEFQISDEDFEQEALKITKLQLEQYGLPISSLSEEQLKEFAASQLSNEEQKKRIAETIIENKVLDYLKENVSLEEKEITLEELKEIYNNDRKAEDNE